MTRLFPTVHAYEAHQRRVHGTARGAPGAFETMTTARLILPYPPSVNHSGKDGFRGGRKTEAYHEFVAEVAKRAAIYVRTGFHTPARLQVSVEVVPPDARKRDLDNLQKVLLDALTKAGVWDDDSQIDFLSIRRYPCNVPGEGSCCVNITRMPAA